MEHKIHGWNLFYVERLARAVKNAISERSLKSAFNFQSLQRQITGSRIKFFEDLHQTFFINFRDSLENYKKWKPNTTSYCWPRDTSEIILKHHLFYWWGKLRGVFIQKII